MKKNLVYRIFANINTMSVFTAIATAGIVGMNYVPATADWVPLRVLFTILPPICLIGIVVTYIVCKRDVKKHYEKQHE